MKALTRKQLTALRATIKGFAVESKDIRRKYIQPNHGDKRDAAWQSKRQLGHYARMHLLAYAFLRGKRREGLEKLNGEKWYLEDLAKEIYQVCHYYGSYRVYYCKELTVEVIHDWMLGSENTIFQQPDPDKFRSKTLMKKHQKRQKLEKAS